MSHSEAHLHSIPLSFPTSRTARHEIGAAPLERDRAIDVRDRFGWEASLRSVVLEASRSFPTPSANPREASLAPLGARAIAAALLCGLASPSRFSFVCRGCRQLPGRLSKMTFPSRFSGSHVEYDRFLSRRRSDDEITGWCRDDAKLQRITAFPTSYREARYTTSNGPEQRSHSM